MKQFKWIVFAICMLFPFSASAVNVVKVNKKATVIEITGLDANLLWSTTDELKNITPPIKIIQVKFIPSATNDRFIIYDTLSDGTAKGPAFFDSGLIADVYERTQDPMGGGVTVSDPYIVIGDCTLGTAANAKIIIIIER